MKILPLAVNFTGKYKEQYATNVSDDVKSRPRRLKPYLKQIARHLPESDTLILTYCSDGLRVGLKTSKCFEKNSLMESDIQLKYSKPISQKEMLLNKTSEYVLKVLPLIIGKERFDDINDEILREIDFPTPYHEFQFMQENYPDDDF